MGISFKIREGQSPRGKARVYFCSHPQDMGYLEEICRDVFQTQDCAVFYYPQEEEVFQKARELELKRMQLFIMLVTTALLTTENQGMVDFRYAREQNIPVLPIMMEPGLEGIFNEKCGEIQMLSKVSWDPTEISYAEKLEKYLSSVLVGDALAKKIREAFDAYVFLSYRKKDRQHAQEMMSLIHRNPLYRDVAIWYDEFLVPGENFDNSIKEILKKSDVFALTVTPNLINEENYVHQEEYPRAKAAGKPQLPIQMVKTDRKELEAQYDGIAPCADGSDQAQVDALLAETVKRIALKPHEDTPEHTFLIGLAYLNGIDVEVDRERGAALVEAAAEAGLPEAMGKIANMYYYGENVEEDFCKAINWQIKLVMQREEAFKASPHMKEYTSLAQDLDKLGGFYMAVKDFSGAEKTYNRLREIAEEISFKNRPVVQRTKKRKSADRKTYDVIKIMTISAYEGLANVCESRGDLEGAMTNLGYAIMASDQGDKKNWQSSPMLRKIHYHLGVVNQKRGKLSTARDILEKLVVQLEKEMRADRTVKIGDFYCACQQKLGEICREFGELSEAEMHMRRALDGQRVLATFGKTYAEEMNLGAAYRDLARIEQEMGRFEDALGDFRESVKICENLLERTKNMQVRSWAATAYCNLGYCLDAMGKEYREEEIALLEKALAIRQGLVDQANAYEDRKNLAISLVDFGKTKLSKEYRQEKIDCFEKALAIRQGLVDQANAWQDRKNLADSLIDLGKAKLDMGCPEEAQKKYQQAYDMLRMMLEENELPDVVVSISNCLGNLGEIDLQNGNMEAAKAHYYEAVDWFGSYSDQIQVVEEQIKALDRATILGYIQWALEDSTWAILSLGEGKALADAISKKCENPRLWAAKKHVYELGVKLTEKYENESLALDSMFELQLEGNDALKKAQELRGKFNS